MIRLLWMTLAAALSASSASSQVDGETLFGAHCARCHGIDGTGGEGPSLAQPVLEWVADDRALADVIRDGIQGTEMPGHRMMSQGDIERVVAYVRSLGRVEPESLSGSSEQGKRLYEERGGCGVCHVVEGEGGILGPELTDIGSRRGAAHLRESLVAPGASVAGAYVIVRVVTGAGRVIRGARVNEDSFTVQLRDESGHFHSFEKRSLAAFEKQFGESLMPSYETEFSPDEIEDLVAYLASLRGGS